MVEEGFVPCLVEPNLYLIYVPKLLKLGHTCCHPFDPGSHDSAAFPEKCLVRFLRSRGDPGVPLSGAMLLRWDSTPPFCANRLCGFAY